MSEKFNDILSEIKGAKKNLSAFSPSQGKDIELSPLTLAQQKLIIETSSDTTLGVLFFNNTFYKILKDNIVNDDIKKYNTIDRVSLTLALRKHLRNEVVVGGEEISISDILEKNKEIDAVVESETINSGDYTFTVEAPDLNLDNFINTHLLNKYKSVKFDDNKLKNLISDLFVFEILKFIKKIEINGKEISLHNELVQSIKLLENIDSVHFQPVTDYINKVRDIETQFAKTVRGDKSIDITPDLFIL